MIELKVWNICDIDLKSYWPALSHYDIITWVLNSLYYFIKWVHSSYYYMSTQQSLLLY